MSRILLLSAIAFVGCTKPCADLNKCTSPQVIGYVREFESQCSIHGNKCDWLYKLQSIQVVQAFSQTQPDNAIAVCNKHGNLVLEKRHIEVLSSNLSKYPQSLNRAVMFHELGHCVLDKEHDFSSHTIMNWETISYQDSEWTALVNDLFTTRPIIDNRGKIMPKDLTTGVQID